MSEEGPPVNERVLGLCVDSVHRIVRTVVVTAGRVVGAEIKVAFEGTLFSPPLYQKIVLLSVYILTCTWWPFDIRS